MLKQNFEKKSKKIVSMKNGPNTSLAANQNKVEDNNQFYLEVDPDLSKDVDIVLPKDNRAMSRATMSAKSRKTAQSGHQSESREHIVRSRGRPIKPHESEPFLFIDNLPPEKSFVSEKSALTSTTAHSRASKPIQNITDESRSFEAQLQRMSAYMSPYNHQTPIPPSPSVATGHIYTKKAQSATGRRTSPRKSPVTIPRSKSAKPPALNEPENKPDIEKDKSVTPTINVTESGNLTDEKKLLNSSNLDVSETKKTKLSRPSTAPAVRETLDGSPIKSRPRSEKSQLMSVKHMSRSNTGSLRSRVSSAGSRSGAGSRAGHNVFGTRSAQSRTGRITPANTPYHSPNKALRQPNHIVKSPFKQTVNQPELVLDGRQTPSMGMKERTALAAFHVHKMLSVAGEKEVHKTTGRLQKGKLKPLYPVNVEGPKIDKCRGIVSETRSYKPSPSRTLQRRVNLMNKIPNVHEYLYERPRTVESVHQTSIASSIDDNFFDMDGPDSNRSLPDEILYAQEKSILEPKTPENTFFSQPTQEESNNVAEESRMFATEVRAADTETKAATDVTVPSHVHHELHQSESGANLQETDELITDDRNNSNTVDTDKGDKIEVNPEAEERTRIGSPSKSVRFAEQKDKLAESEINKEIKEKENEKIAKQQRDALQVKDEDIDDDDVIETVSKKNKQDSKGSCKSESDEIIFKKDEDKDDDGNSKDNNRRNNDRNMNTDSSGNGTQTKDKDDNKENISGTGNESGQKRPMSGSQTRSQSAGTRHRSRSKDKGTKSSDHNKQVCKTNINTPSSTKSASKGVHCSRFQQSKASNAHTNTLEVSSVLHGDSVTTVLGPESPKRGRSRSASPNRSREQTFQFFSQKNRPCYEYADDFSSLYGNSQRSKVKFLLEDEEPEVETIFVEDEDDIDVKPDKEITYDVLDTEIEMLRSAIQNSLLTNNDIQNEEKEIMFDDVSEETEVESVEESECETVVQGNDTMDTIRGDYSSLLDKYRQRCMDRSESYGAISTTLVTPRETQSLTSSRSRSLSHEVHKNLSANRNNNSEGQGLETKNLADTQPLNGTLLSDSGHGSAENLSDLSRSTSRARSDVPKLDLGGSCSDLGLGSGRSDETVTSGNKEENSEEDVRGKTLLQMVCDQLSPFEQPRKPAKRREIDEEVSDLKVVATTKSLTKNSKMKNSGAGAIQAPFPPVCFKVNARPPRGYLYYFAYGPDMNPNRFSSYIQKEIQDRYWGLLFGFNLVFNKKGTSEEAGGFANLEFNPLRSVEGCIYKITPQELQILDKCVGYPQHYEHLVLPVWMSNSLEADGHGVAQYCVPALTYIAQNKWTETEKPLNCDYALSQCIKSADIVTTAYKDSLVAMATQQEVMASA